MNDLLHTIARQLAAAELYDGQLPPSEAWRRCSPQTRWRYARLAGIVLAMLDVPRLRRPRMANTGLSSKRE